MTDTLRLLGPRLALEPFLEACISESYLGWLNDPLVTRFSNQRFRTHTRESACAYIGAFAGSASLLLGIRLLPENERLIGTITAHVAPAHGTADMGLMIGERACWGRGYGLEAWTLLLGHLFGPLALRKVTAGTVRPNLGMRIIMERSGMHLEAIRQRQELIEGVEEDVLYFARFRSD
jgi:ribosomal-protein-alanine N-acetyltransferase